MSSLADLAALVARVLAESVTFGDAGDQVAGGTEPQAAFFGRDASQPLGAVATAVDAEQPQFFGDVAMTAAGGTEPQAPIFGAAAVQDPAGIRTHPGPNEAPTDAFGAEARPGLGQQRPQLGSLARLARDGAARERLNESMGG